MNTYHSLNKKMNIKMGLTITEIKISGNQFSLQKLSKTFTQAYGTYSDSQVMAIG